MSRTRIFTVLIFSLAATSPAFSDPPVSGPSKSSVPIIQFRGNERADGHKTQALPRATAPAEVKPEVHGTIPGSLGVSGADFVVETWINGVQQTTSTKQGIVTPLIGGLRDGANKITIRVTTQPGDPPRPKFPYLWVDVTRTELPSEGGRRYGHRRVFYWDPPSPRTGEFSYTFVVKRTDLRTDPDPHFKKK